MKRQIGQLLIFIFIVVFAIKFIENPYTDNYLASWKKEAIVTMQSKDALYKEIEIKAKLYAEEPVDAVIDKVWKAIPGYNGLAVDVQKSYEKMKKEQYFNEKELVFKEIKPSVSLKDLDANPIYK